MIRQIKLTLFFLIGLFSSNIFASTEHMLSKGLTYEINLPSNEPQIITNTYFWTIEGNCIIASEVENNPFSFTVLRKSGTLNGVTLLKDDSMDIIVHPGDYLHITAASGGRIELVNRGTATIKAICANK